MIALPVTLALLCIIGLLAHAVLPSASADRRAVRLGRWIPIVLSIQMVLAFVTLGALGVESGFRPWTLHSPFLAVTSIYVDGMSSLMLCLVSFVGWVVARFSVRYLDGDPRQGSYFKWLAVTAGCVSAMVISGNLVQFTLFWIGTSLGLHQLLLHFPERRAARRAAWTKFAVGRAGDVMLIAAGGLTYSTFGTVDFAELLPQAQLLLTNGASTDSQQLIAWLLMLAAVTKSAQFPFHTWLPNTMETPTPVSALMHAGIVNAGGYLIIRLSPLFALSPSAMATLTLIGTLTACGASVAMMCQSSVKRSLAYSTIAQMGFMMLQCGLGAFSAAMLHILAHSLYKAHAFLASGSVIAEAQALRPTLAGRSATQLSLAQFAFSAVGVAAVFAAVLYLFQLNPAYKAGGLALAYCMCLALATWSWGSSTASGRWSQNNLLRVAMLSSIYAVSYLVVDALLQPTATTIASWPYAPALLTVVAIAFTALFVLHIAIRSQATSNWLLALRVHAINGFYVDVLYQRLFRSLHAREA